MNFREIFSPLVEKREDNFRFAHLHSARNFYLKLQVHVLEIVDHRI